MEWMARRWGGLVRVRGMWVVVAQVAALEWDLLWSAVVVAVAGWAEVWGLLCLQA